MAEFKTLEIDGTNIQYDTRLTAFSEQDSTRVALVNVSRNELSAYVDVEQDGKLVYEPRYGTRLIRITAHEYRVEVNYDDTVEEAESGQ